MVFSAEGERNMLIAALQGTLPWLSLLGDFIGNGVEVDKHSHGTPLGPLGRCDAILAVKTALLEAHSKGGVDRARLVASAPDLYGALVVDDAIQRLGLTVEACEEIEAHGIVIDANARGIRNIALGKWATEFRRVALAKATGDAARAALGRCEAESASPEAPDA
jgi:hypothetical protein